MKGNKAVSRSGKLFMLRDTAVFAGANYVIQALGIVNSIALRRFMGPAAMGVWSILQVILGYCGYANLGTTKAMARDYPYYRGRGNHAQAEQLKDLVVTFSMVMSVIPAVVILIYLVLQWHQLILPLRFGLLFMVGFLFIERFSDVILDLLRADKKFILLSKVKVLDAVSGLLVTLILVSWWNIYGLVIGTALVTVGCLLFIYRTNPYQFNYVWESTALWRELKLGIPLIAATFLGTILKSLDKLIIAKELGFYEVGLYSIVTMVNNYMFSLPMAFSNVWYPYMQEEFGRQGGANGIKNYLLTPVFTLSILVPFLTGMAVFLMPLVAQVLLPKFMGGLPAMKIYLLGTFFVLLGQFSGKFLVTLDKYLLNIPLLGVSAGLNYILNITFVKMGWGLEGVALGTLISFVFYGITSYFVALKNFSNGKESALVVGRMLLTVTAFFGSIFLLDRWVHPESVYVAAFLKVALFCLFSAPFFWVAERKVGLWRLFREGLSRKGAPYPPAAVEETNRSGD